MSVAFFALSPAALFVVIAFPLWFRYALPLPLLPSSGLFASEGIIRFYRPANRLLVKAIPAKSPGGLIVSNGT